jgi:hypothetical protein
MKDVQTQPGTDIDSDHNLLVAKICTTLKRIIRFRKNKSVWDLEKRARKPWITQEIISQMDKQRKWKSVNNEEGIKNTEDLIIN